jgi:hypothetical protein
MTVTVNVDENALPAWNAFALNDGHDTSDQR